MLILKSELRGIPSEIQVIPYGYYNTGKGPFLLDAEAAASIVQEFNRLSNDIIIDYEHQTFQGGPAPAAGWIKKLVNRGTEGIWAVVEWTDRAKEYLKNREYRYLSPVFLKRVSDSRVMKFINAALTNQPAIDGMVPVANKGFEYSFPLRHTDIKASEALAALTAAKWEAWQQADKDLTYKEYKEAFVEVQKENPELVARYIEEMLGFRKRS